MARVHYVKKSRKPQGNCDKCGAEITVGVPYKWVGLRPSGPGSHLVKRRCGNCPPWRQSELSFSKMAGVYAAQETWEDFLGSEFESADDVQSALDDVADQIQEVADEYRESAENMEQGLGHSTYLSDELNEKADTLELWADEIRNAEIPDAPDESDFDEDNDEDNEGDDREAVNEDGETFDEAMDNWRDEVVQISEPNDCPV